jgi:riboflavin kinase/FMN adenylyltransferase
MFAGSNFRFGKNREGTIEGNRNFARRLGLDIIAVDLKQTHSIKGKELETISSQRIRKLIQNGQLDIANSLLGRNWCITGIVEKGKQQGREIGFPTANLNIKNFLKPPLGVYVTRLKIIDQKELENSNDWLPSISNIGTRPTVSGDSINLETHIIDLNNKDFDINLYGKRIRVELLEFLRSEKKFNSLSELKKQIEFDTKKAYNFHKLR